MTETSPVSTQTRADDSVDRRVATVGRVHPHVEVKVIDPTTSRTAPRDEPGELCTRGYSVMLGYWDDEASTAAAIDRARWMHTGDLAVMDADGYVRIVGRIKDVIIRGGENISPREIEEVLLEHPEVADAQVFGVPDERLGEVVAVWVVPREGAAPDPEELRAHVAAALARFKVPRHVRLVDGFPLTITGKVQKFRMRELEAELLAQEAAAAAT
jgi:fatty-acyl-CoA synthase